MLICGLYFLSKFVSFDLKFSPNLMPGLLDILRRSKWTIQFIWKCLDTLYFKFVFHKILKISVNIVYSHKSFSTMLVKQVIYPGTFIDKWWIFTQQEYSVIQLLPKQMKLFIILWVILTVHKSWLLYSKHT